MKAGAGAHLLLWQAVVSSYVNYIISILNFYVAPQGQPKAGYLKGLSIIGVQQIDRVVEVVEETLTGTFHYLVKLYLVKNT